MSARTAEEDEALNTGDAIPIIREGNETMPLRIDATLQSLIPPLSAEEYATLEANIVHEGCRDPLVIWAEEQVLLDGHNRYQICTAHDLPYATVEVHVPTRDAAKLWMLTNQLGRRNLTPEQTSYFRGAQYELCKKQGFKGNRHTSSRDQNDPHQNTAQLLAATHNTSEATMKRDAAFARAVDTIADTVGVEARQAILAGAMPLTQQHVQALAGMAETDPQAVDAVLKAVQAAPTLKAAKAHVTQALAEVLCKDCHRPLTATDSRARGIGPICVGHGRARPSARGATPSAGPVSVGETGELPSFDALYAEVYAEVHDEMMAEFYSEERAEIVQALAPLTAVLGLAPLDDDHDCYTFLDTHVAAAVERFLAAATPTHPTPPTAKKEAYGSLIHQVRAVVQRHGPCSCDAVAKHLDAENKAVWQALQSLIKQGVIRREKGTDVYQWIAA